MGQVMNIYKTQIKRELWENKISFIYTPIIVSFLILAFIACAAFYSKGVINDKGVHFVAGSSGNSVEAGVFPDSGVGVRPITSENIGRGSINMKIAVAQDPSLFQGMVITLMYTNCIMLYLVFSIVLGAYALRCLFDDRKNKDILFWRSMPVSETTNVLTKLAMIFLVGPLMILLLNIFVILVVVFIGLTYFGSLGVSLGSLISSLVDGGTYYIPFQVFYELIFSLLMLLPVIGLALFASAFARKTPFFIFATPFLLVLADKLLKSFFGISIGFSHLLLLYGNAIELTKDAFMLQHPLRFTQEMVLPLLTSVAIGGAFITAAIWLRNNRYEI